MEEAGWKIFREIPAGANAVTRAAERGSVAPPRRTDRRTAASGVDGMRHGSRNSDLIRSASSGVAGL